MAHPAPPKYLISVPFGANRFWGRFLRKLADFLQVESSKGDFRVFRKASKGYQVDFLSTPKTNVACNTVLEERVGAM